jgi:pSer/pThr/pTyr-binding forkhead associated (FHA) protein
VLFAIEGADAGLSFPIDRPQMQIGRSLPGRGREGEIRLTDRSVSSRHALLSYDDGRVSIEHLPSATNPTLVNGRRVKRSKQLREGDRIVLGLAVLELRALPRPALEPPLPRVPGSPPASSDDGEPVDARAALVVREGPPELIGKRFPLTQRRTALGRDEDCDIVLDVGAVSRRHAALLWQGDQLILVHESRVNPTHVNDMPIADRRRVFDGDEITLSERVTLELVLEAHREEPARAAPPAPSRADDAEATRLTSPPVPPAADPTDAEATRISLVSPPPGRPEPRGTPPPAAAADAGETFIEAPSDPKPGDDAETRIMQAPDAPSFAPSFEEGDATRIAEPPESPKPGDAGETRIMQAPDAPSFAPSFEEGDATRIAEPPAADASRDSGATRVVEPPEPGDEARTMIRPAPRLPAPPDDGPRTRIIDLDAVLRAESPPPDASEQATVIRQGPRVEPEQPGSRPERRDLDSEKTLIRPVPGAKKSPAGDAPAAETVIIQTPDAEDDD